MKTFTILILLWLLVSPAHAENWNITRAGGITTDWFNDVKTVGDIAYTATRYGLVLMDVSDKHNPVVHSRIETNGIGLDVVVRDTLYINLIKISLLSKQRVRHCLVMVSIFAS